MGCGKFGCPGVGKELDMFSRVGILGYGMFWFDIVPCGVGLAGDSLGLLIGKDTIPLVFGFLARSYGCAIFSG